MVAGRAFGSLFVAPVFACLTVLSSPAITVVRAAGEVTYTKDIAPILWRSCAGCHRPGEIGPFSLLTYEDAQKRADFLVEITANRRMPPWRAEPGFGKFHDERRLSDGELATIANWAKSGAPQGDPKDLPKPPEFSDGWQLGQPDLILKMPEPFAIPASGPDVYRCFVIPIPLEEDTMVSAVEFRPGNRSVVHHAIMFLDANGAGRKLEGKDGQRGFESFGGPVIVPTGGLGAWAPGAMPRFLPDGIVKYVEQGSDLVLQLHYHPTGKEEMDQSVVGLYYAKKPAKKIVTGVAIVQPKLHLPAGNPRCEVNAETIKLPVDVHVLGISPHMHNLGREIKVTAVDPTGKKTAPLIWIKDWDFNWQGAYQFARPIRLPKGSKIKVQAFYDNSADNAKNPNSPPKDVTWGEQTNDEMCLCTVQVFTDTLPDLRKVAAMPAHELGAGIEGGVPAVASVAKRGPGKSKAAARTEALANEPPAAEPDPAEHAANATAAKNKKESARPAATFPEGGVPIAASIRPLFREYDTDGNGILSRAEAEKLPPVVRERIVENLTKAQGK